MAAANAAVLGGVGQAREVNAVALAVLVHHQLAVLAVLRQNLVMLALGVDAGRTLAKVDLAGKGFIFEDEVVGSQVLYLSVLREKPISRSTPITSDSWKYRALVLAGGGLAHTDEAAALVHKLADGGHDLLVDPVLGAAEGGVGIAYIDDNADVLGDAARTSSKLMNSPQKACRSDIPARPRPSRSRGGKWSGAPGCSSTCAGGPSSSGWPL